MKKQTIFRSIVAIIVISFAIATSSCKKENDQEKLQQKIDQVIPQAYIDTLKHLGITINDGTTPPDVQGIYEIQPATLKASNISADVIGTVFSVMKVKLFSQSNSDFSIQLYGKNFLGANDTSLVTAISGSGNNFTVYGKVKAFNGSNSAVFALIISGTKETDGLKNVVFGLINIDNSNGNGSFIQEGKARLFYDSDLTSNNISTFRLASATLATKQKSAGER